MNNINVSEGQVYKRRETDVEAIKIITGLQKAQNAWENTKKGHLALAVLSFAAAAFAFPPFGFTATPILFGVLLILGIVNAAAPLLFSKSHYETLTTFAQEIARKHKMKEAAYTRLAVDIAENSDRRFEPLVREAVGFAKVAAKAYKEANTFAGVAREAYKNIALDRLRANESRASETTQNLTKATAIAFAAGVRANLAQKKLRIHELLLPKEDRNDLILKCETAINNCTSQIENLKNINQHTDEKNAIVLHSPKEKQKIMKSALDEVQKELHTLHEITETLSPYERRGKKASTMVDTGKAVIQDGFKKTKAWLGFQRANSVPSNLSS